MPNIVNQLVNQELEHEFQDAQGMLLVSFGGLTVSESENLRGKLAEKGVQFRMVRNSIARRVLKARGVEFEAGALVGNTAIAYGDAEAAIHAAKVLTDKDVKKAGKVQVQAGLLDGDILGQQDASALADVPDKDTLRAKILGCISGPAQGLVGCLNGNPAGLARLLQARIDKGE